MAFIKTSTLLLLLAWRIQEGRGQDIRKTMMEQLAALKGYSNTVEKGYRLVEEGLHLVGDIKSGEFHLHQVFFRSLKTVDEATLQCPSVNEAFRLLSAIDKDFHHDLDDRKTLRMLTTDGALSMTDGERIRQVEEIAATLRTRYGYIKSFLAGIASLISQRQKEQAFTGILKKWYGIQ